MVIRSPAKLNNVCYAQAESTNTFKNTVTQKTLKIYNKVYIEKV